MSACSIIKETGVWGIPKSVIEIETMRAKICKNGENDCPFEDVPTCEASVNQEDERPNAEDVEDYFKKEEEPKHEGVGTDFGRKRKKNMRGLISQN